VRYAGIDVGGRRKGFHAAVIDDAGILAGPLALRSTAEVVEWVAGEDPCLVAVDSPRSPAPTGSHSRGCERELRRAVCGIRYTPERKLIVDNPYYEWIIHGFELYSSLEAAGLDVVECFPTASFTRWAGPRLPRTRAEWSRVALTRLGFDEVRHGQDGRDAVGAALTAREHVHGTTDRFGEIVVPTTGPRSRAPT
jgi:predicted nuclease with RNAse H fold